MSERGLRVLIVTTDFPPSIGGIQEWTAQIAAHLAVRHDVTVIAPHQRDSGPYDRATRFRIVRFRQGRGRVMSLGLLALAMLREVLCRKPDVVLWGHTFAAVAGHPVCRWFGIPSVLVAHGMEIHARRAQRFVQGILGQGDACIAVSRATAAILQGKGATPSSIVIVGNGAAPDLLTAVWPPEHTAHDLHLPDGSPVILTLSRLNERYKGHDAMLHALPLIVAQVPWVTYVIAGEGRYRPYYERLAQALNVQEHVIFTGRITEDERVALLDRCDLFAMVSREECDGSAEGFGIAFLEAAARGKPVVGGRSGGVPDAIVGGVTGLLVDPTDTGAIADACIQLLRDRGLAQRLGCAGRERVRNAYTWEHIAQRVEGVLLRVVVPSAAGKPSHA